ncbi:MAG: toll/interleukin-1 receptor domain-containing protein [bacterium]|nr:toll/interleukin-1 receptor domain-containing protein [bacterium]
MSKIFICYRRKTCGFPALAVYQKLKDEFGEDHVFMDLQISPGENFREKIQRTIDRSDVLLTLIDRDWLTITDEDGTPKLETPDDVLRNEIEQGLQRGIVVLPVLLDGTEMPHQRRLPESIHELTECNAAKARTGNDFEKDMEELIRAVKSAPEEVADAREEVRRFLQMWDNGDWVAAHRILETALAEDRTTIGRPLVVMKARRDTAARLADSVAAFERSDFEGALRLLTEIAIEEGPPNLEAACEIARLGDEIERLASDSSDPARVSKLTKETRRVIEAAEGAILPGRREVEELLDKVRRDSDYQAAVELIQEGRFTRAREALERLGTYRDAAAKASLSSHWQEFFQLLRDRHWNKGKAKLREIRGLDPSAPIQRWQWWCNLARRLAPALEKMAAGPAVRDPNVPWSGSACPYETLARSPQVSLEEFNELSYELQEEGMSEGEREAWDAVRKADLRRLVDFSLYPVADPKRAGRLLERILEISEGIDPETALTESLPSAGASSASMPLLERIGAALGEDRGVLLALMLNYEEAIEAFLDEIRQRPADPRALHKLGLAAAARIYLYGVSEAPPEIWEHLAVSWGAVFADDRFWRRWWAGRRKVYKSTGKQIEKARHDLERFWLDEIRSSGDAHLGFDVAFQTEVEGARAVNAGGGVPVSTESADERIVVGPLGASRLGLNGAIAKWAATFPSTVLDEPSWQRRVTFYFSELAEANILFEEGQFAKTLAATSRIRSVPGTEFPSLNPGFASLPGARTRFKCSLLELQEQAHARLALEAVSEIPVDVERAMEHWREAAQLASRRDRPETVVAEIGQVAIGRAAALRKDRDREELLGGLNDAIKLLQYVIDEGWDHDLTVRDALIDALIHRAIHLSNTYDRESDARLDAQRAWSLSPDSLKAISVLCAASLHDARDRLMNGRRDLAEALLKEVEEHLSSGLARYPNSSELAQSLENLEILRGMLSDETPLDPGQASKATSAVDGDGRNRLTEAMLSEVQQDQARAIDLYWELVQSNPEDRNLRGRMAWCYRTWIQHLQGTGGDPAEIRRISREALERCPGFDALRDMAPESEDGGPDE